MATFQSRATLAAALVLSTVTAFAQEAPTATIKLADGTKVEGRATRYDDVAQTLYFTTAAGKPLVLTLQDLDARSAYLVNRSKPDRGDAEQQLQLANFARDAELFAHARRHYRYAKQAAPERAAEIDAQVEVLKARAAAYCMRKLEAARKAKNRTEATKWAKVLLDKLPDSTEAQRAREMMDALYAESHHTRDDHLEASSADLLAGELKKGKVAYDAMLKANKKGLVAKNSSAARRSFNLAVKKGAVVLRELDKVAKKHTDAGSQETLSGYRKLVVEQVIATHLNLASLFMVQSDYKGALRETNRALAHDAKNQSALAMRSRIENASSRGIRGWW